ncbi:uncharacterized protein MELLADRAFT_96263 [Melampsora larici-populina 98AG31]|uniref:Uncharacterized protein n=1 Tax=Melampsora larici-populina (strain 98AG31 / pathotype 3-4-7) TaxID=747676 RepID=F4RE50_MELLP|nr:uncharacterized protein MELLADRAFT_96263 [Melampsora larici-populina 98AG31]EGG09332.1 hypothetical protein MELLADRAFT_96263 [Melampsora larici-populina 98AG31]
MNQNLWESLVLCYLMDDIIQRSIFSFGEKECLKTSWNSTIIQRAKLVAIIVKIFKKVLHFSRLSRPIQSGYSLSSNIQQDKRTAMSWATYFSGDRMQGSESENGSEDTPGVWRPLSQFLTWPFTSSCADESPVSTCYYNERADHKGITGARWWCLSSQMKTTTSPNSRDSHECSQQIRNRSSDKTRSSIEPSEMVMNFSYTPPTLFNTVNHNRNVGVEEREATSGMVRTCLVGEEPGFVRSPHSAPNRDWSHGLPYPFQKRGLPTANKMKTTVLDHSHILPSKNRPLALTNPNGQDELIESDLTASSTMLKINTRSDQSLGIKLRESKFTFIGSTRENSSLLIHHVRLRFCIAVLYQRAEKACKINLFWNGEGRQSLYNYCNSL